MAQLKLWAALMLLATLMLSFRVSDAQGLQDDSSIKMVESASVFLSALDTVPAQSSGSSIDNIEIQNGIVGISIPHLTMEAQETPGNTLKDILRSTDFTTVIGLLKQFSANRIEIPSVTMKMDVFTFKLSVTFKNVVVSRVTNGIVNDLTISGGMARLTGTSIVGDGSFGLISAAGLDSIEALKILTEGSSKSDDVSAPVLRSLTVAKLHFNFDDGTDLDLSSLEAGGLGLSLSENSPLAPSQIGAKGVDSSALVTSLAGGLRMDRFSIFAAGLYVADKTAPVNSTMSELSIEGLANGEIKALNLSRLELDAASGRTSVEADNIRAHGVNFGRLLNLIADQAAGASASAKQDDLVGQVQRNVATFNNFARANSIELLTVGRLIVNSDEAAVASKFGILRFEIAGLQNGAIRAISCEKLDFTNKSGTSGGLGQFSLRNYDLNPLMDWMAANPSRLVNSPPPTNAGGPSQFPLAALPSLEYMSAGDMFLIIPATSGNGNYGSGVSNLLKLRKFEISNSAREGRSLNFVNFLFDVPASFTEPGVQTFLRTRFPKLDVSLSSRGGYDPVAQALSAVATVTSAGMGSITFSTKLGNFDPTIFTGDDATRKAAAPRVTIQEFTARVENRGLLENFIAFQASGKGQLPEEVRQQYLSMFLSKMRDLVTNDQQDEALTAIRDFFTNAKSLVVRVSFKPGIRLTDVFLYRTPEQFRKSAEISATVPRDAPSDAKPAKLPDVGKVGVIRYVPSGQESFVGFFTGLNPDCSPPLQPPVARLVAAPHHGEARFSQGEGFPTYPVSSAMAKCNSSKVPGLRVQYKSEQGFVGEDTMDVLVIFSGGGASQITYSVQVK